MKIDVKAKAREVYEQGFCILESIWSEKECRAAQQVLHRIWQSSGSPAMHGWGWGVHPLLPRAPELASQFAKPEMIDVMAEVMRDDVRLVHTGARYSDNTSAPSIGWHEHYSWDVSGLAGRDRIERLLGGCYVTGTRSPYGPLIVYPRKLNDPLDQPFPDKLGDWPGQIVVEVPPGSSVIFDTALWHNAKVGTAAGIRYGWGGHFHGWSEDRVHPEDNDCDPPEVKDMKQAHPAFARLVQQQVLSQA